MRVVPRHLFVPERLRRSAYADGPLPIAEGQTVSQPYIVAATVEALDPGPADHVLEIGAGSGYAAAVLAEIVEHVVAVERRPALAEEARNRLHELGYDNVEIVCADGSLGWPAAAPYDAIAVAAAGPEIPTPLLEQLAPGGRLVVPVGERSHQDLLRVVRRDDGTFERRSLGGVRFVPLVGAEGWRE